MLLLFFHLVNDHLYSYQVYRLNVVCLINFVMCLLHLWVLYFFIYRDRISLRHRLNTLILYELATNAERGELYVTSLKLAKQNKLYDRVMTNIQEVSLFRFLNRMCSIPL